MDFDTEPDIDYKEGDVNDFLRWLISSPPKEKCTVAFELSDPNKDVYDLSNELALMLVRMIKMLLGVSNFDIASLDNNTMGLAKQYFRSFGIDLCFDLIPPAPKKADVLENQYKRFGEWVVYFKLLKKV